MELERGSGILLHPTSLPGPHGSGDIGPEAVRLLDWLAAAGQRYWQVLPLVPVGWGSSPYSGLSAFAANPMLVSPERLLASGLLDASDLTPPSLDAHRIGFDVVARHRQGLLTLATGRFGKRASASEKERFQAFRAESSAWLPDWSLFAALREQHGGQEWTRWPAALAQRDPQALDEARRTFADRIVEHELVQFFFREQWDALRSEARRRGIRIVGDVPIFVAHDSADVWAHPELFHLDPSGQPTVVAGVPPDFFSATGQRWGNPLYRWERLEATDFRWWVQRFEATLALVDVVRIDHFRGFAACWEIPASEETAVDGRWTPAPGASLFSAVRAALGDVPIIAEDLGIITPDVVELRESLGFPGMRILEFAFGSGPKNAYLPHNHDKNTVVYTGTHDNDTVLGWWHSISEEERHLVRDYCSSDGSEPHWDLLRLACGSVAKLSLAPLQDVMGLAAEGRMNVPGKPDGNWAWRFDWSQLPSDSGQRMRQLCATFGRLP